MDAMAFDPPPLVRGPRQSKAHRPSLSSRPKLQDQAPLPIIQTQASSPSRMWNVLSGHLFQPADFSKKAVGQTTTQLNPLSSGTCPPTNHVHNRPEESQTFIEAEDTDN